MATSERAVRLDIGSDQLDHDGPGFTRIVHGDKLFSMTTDHREGARARIADLVALLKSTGDAGVETDRRRVRGALTRDRGVSHGRHSLPDLQRRSFASREDPRPYRKQTALLEQIRTHLEAAGFHTRSHQSPTQAKTEEA